MPDNFSHYPNFNGVQQYMPGLPRVSLGSGWHHPDTVCPFVGSEGVHCRRAAVFVGELLSLPETLCHADEGLLADEREAASILDGDVYTIGCRSAHGIQDVVAQVLLDCLHVEDRRRADWAICQGAAFHADSVFDEVFALFHISGAPGELHLPRLGYKIPMSQGSWAIFDCAEPHGFINDGREQFDASSNRERGLTRFLNVGLDFDFITRNKAGFRIPTLQNYGGGSSQSPGCRRVDRYG